MSRPGVRGRTTLAATLAMGLLALSMAGALLWLLQRGLVAGVDSEAGRQAAGVRELLVSGRLGTQVPSASDEEALVQVLDQAGNVLAATDNVAGEAAMSRQPITAGAEDVRTLSGLPIGQNTERFRLLVRGVDTPQGPRRIVVALSLVQTDRAVQVAAGLVAGLVPIALLLTAAGTWLAVGQALAPVERIRAAVAGIAGNDVTNRVPVPAAADEVRRLAETMNELLERVQATHLRQRRFVADASHELRSPLTAMGAALEVALPRHDLALWEQTGAELLTEHARTLALVEDLLLLARLDGQVPPVRTEVDLEDLVHEQAKRLRGVPGVQVRTAPLPAVRVSGDPAQLARVLRNLTDNAARHAAGMVRLSLSIRGDEAVVQVGDDGPGIAPADAERVFDRFSRLDAARDRDTGGTGLGLAISRGIAQSHGGTLRVLPEPPPGAVLELRLPLAP